MSRGSTADFSARMSATASNPSSASRNLRLPRPTPCSPVQVPSKAIARAASRLLIHSTCFTSFFGVGIEEDVEMEIAVSYMTDERRDHARPHDILGRLLDARGEVRDRHADIRRKPARPGTQELRRENRGRAGVSQVLALLVAARPSNSGSAVTLRDAAHGLDVSRDRSLASGEFKKQGRSFENRSCYRD
jgi:hypothetical protein